LAAPVAEKVRLLDNKRKIENFDRFNEEFVTTYMEERK
jgi:hypothetical protein